MGNDSERFLRDAKPVRAVLHMGLPMLAAMSVTVLANLFDSFFVGQLGDAAALAAVALALPFTTLVMACGDLVGMGSSTAIARRLGAGDREGAKRTSATSVWAAVAFGAVLAALCLAFLPQLCTLLGANGDMHEPTMTYVGILCLGAPFFVAAFVLDSNVRAEGASVLSAAASIVSTVVNVVLDALFILGLGWGIAGAALATALSWAVMALMLAAACSRLKAQSLSLRKVEASRAMLHDIFGVGLSAFAMSLLTAVSGWVLDVLAASYSTEAVAAIGIAFRLQMVVGLFGISFGQGVIPLFGYAFAARNRRRLGGLARATVGIEFGSMLAAAAAMIALSQPIMGLFSDDAAVIGIGAFAMVSFIASAVIAAGSELILGVTQAFGRAMPATVLSVVRGAVLIVGFAVGNALFGLEGLIASQVATEALALAVSLAFVPYLVRTVRNTGKMAPEKVASSASEGAAA